MRRNTPTLPIKLPLRVVCAWCGRKMSPGVEPTSHGMCALCEALGQCCTLPRTLDSDIMEDR